MQADLLAVPCDACDCNAAVHVPGILRHVEKPAVGHEPHMVRDRLNRSALRSHVVGVYLVVGVLHVYEDGAHEVEVALYS